MQVRSNQLRFVADVLNSASDIAKNSFGTVSWTIKAEDRNQVLTETDLAISKFLIDKIREVFPAHNIIDEEAGIIDNNSEYTWVIDPIDGTSNFARGIPLYGIMVGLMRGDSPAVGGIALPSFSEIYFAEKGTGTWCNNAKVRVTEETDLASILVAYGIDRRREDPNFTKKECRLLARIILNVLNIRSSNSVFDAVMVAKGKYGAVLNRSSRIWDNVAQQIVIEEAGGMYTDFFGRPLDYSDPLSKANENYTFCAAPPALHRQLQQILHGSEM